MPASVLSTFVMCMPASGDVSVSLEGSVGLKEFGMSARKEDRRHIILRLSKVLFSITYT